MPPALFYSFYSFELPGNLPRDTEHRLDQAVREYIRWLDIFVGAFGETPEAAAEFDTLWIVRKLFGIRYLDTHRTWRIESEIQDPDKWLFSDQRAPDHWLAESGRLWNTQVRILEREWRNWRNLEVQQEDQENIDPAPNQQH